MLLIHIYTTTHWELITRNTYIRFHDIKFSRYRMWRDRTRCINATSAIRKCGSHTNDPFKFNFRFGTVVVIEWTTTKIQGKNIIHDCQHTIVAHYNAKHFLFRIVVMQDMILRLRKSTNNWTFFINMRTIESEYPVYKMTSIWHIVIMHVMWADVEISVYCNREWNIIKYVDGFPIVIVLALNLQQAIPNNNSSTQYIDTRVEMMLSSWPCIGTLNWT